VIQRRNEQVNKLTPEISELLPESGQLGLIQADALLVMDLDLCIKCDEVRQGVRIAARQKPPESAMESSLVNILFRVPAAIVTIRNV